MRNILLMLLCVLLPFCIKADNNYILSSSCGGVNYKIISSCKLNSLRDDQDKISMPICDSQTLFMANKEIKLVTLTGKVNRIDKNNKKVSMMNYVFYNSACVNNKYLALSAFGGCNACGEMFKSFWLDGRINNHFPSKTDNSEDILPDKLFGYNSSE